MIHDPGLNLFSISGLLLGITSIVLSLIISIYGKAKIHRIWSLFNLSVAIWGIGAFFAGIADTKTEALIWWRLNHIGVILMPIFIFHFVHTLCNLPTKKILIAVYLQGVIFLILDSTNLFISDVRFVFSSFYYAVLGPTYNVFFPIWIALVCYSHYKLFVEYQRTTIIKRNQLLYLFMGTAVGFLGGVTNFLPGYKIDIYPYGNFSIPLYGMIIAYAILRHRLMDIQVIIKKSIVFAALFASILGMFVGITLLTQELLAGGSFLGIAISTIIIILTVRPLENFLVRVTDRFLFQKKYDYRELLRTLSREVITIMELGKLTKRVVDDLVNIMRLESCGIMVYDKNREVYDFVASRGVKAGNTIFGEESPIISVLKTTHISIRKDEDIEEMDDKNTIKEDMKKLNAELILPLIVHDDLIGIISLGMKKSGEEYNQDDMAVLEALAGTASVAISNAQYVVNTMRLEVEAAQREKMAVIGTLAAGINHEICNPLGIARGQCEVYLLNQKEGLYKDKPKDEQIAEAMKVMEKVVRESDRATAITKKLSSFAKPSKGEISEDVKIREEIDEVMALVDHELKLEKIETNINIPEDLPYIRCDRKQLQQVLFNIIRNAGQAISEKGAIEIDAKTIGKKIRIKIKDTGPGISQEKLSEVFNPFYTTKEPGKGTGLGLFIVRQLMERNNGRISVDSEVGKGTTFMLEFPVLEKAKV